MNQNDHIEPSIWAHSAVRLTEPIVRAIPGRPGNYVVDFGPWDMHVTPEGWRQINTAVEQGISVQQKQPIDIIGEYVRAFRGDGS